jgi:putative hydrolase
MVDIDPQNPEAMQQALAGGLFEPEDSEQQKAALVRLETNLALVEGWVDDVVREATRDRMPSGVQLAETVRRRRAAGGPAEQTFATLVGLQLRPRRLRDAANLWAAVRDARGVEGRDHLWSHPDLLPTATDLDDPIGFAQHAGELSDIDITDFLDDQGPSDQPPTPDDTK